MLTECPEKVASLSTLLSALLLCEWLLLPHTVPPGPPRDFFSAVGRVGATFVSLDWDPPTDTGVPGITSYRIRALNIDIMTNSSDTSFNVTGLLPNTNYTFTVAAVASLFGVSAEGPQSAEVNVTTGTTGGCGFVAF